MNYKQQEWVVEKNMDFGAGIQETEECFDEAAQNHEAADPEEAR
jgi:hypothetical protein